jgi:type IV pilus assembly protein PilA
MISKIRNSRAAFTLVEIMIVVAIIGLLAALAIPGFVKARKQSQGRRIINDARQMDAAIDQWALEKGKKDGDAVNTTEAATYLKTGTWLVNDILGNPYTIGAVGTGQILISTATKSSLDGVGIDWGAY